jgi:hypothetical protein
VSSDEVSSFVWIYEVKNVFFSPLLLISSKEGKFEIFWL